MTEGIIATVIFTTKPEATDACIEAMKGMFAETRGSQGFRHIQLVRSAHDPHELALIQEWDSVEDHQAYMKHRADIGDVGMLLAMTDGEMQLKYWITPPLAGAKT